MPSYFCDTSAIVKRYVLEGDSTYINELTNPHNGNVIVLCRITTVEFAAAIARRLKSKSITEADAEDALYAFQSDFANRYAYEFDQRGNWLKQTETEFNSKYPSLRYLPSSVSYREITYF